MKKDIGSASPRFAWAARRSASWYGCHISTTVASGLNAMAAPPSFVPGTPNPVSVVSWGAHDCIVPFTRQGPR
ncbi:MAG TPA: hypothetical protein VFE76_00075 [Myxococcales bacterium]|nr:hypothetical protein [Myxococcales bacterium]